VTERGHARPGEPGSGETGWVRAGVRDDTGRAGLGRRAGELWAARPCGPGRTERGRCVAALNATY
jgi:hypothetical protein